MSYLGIFGLKFGNNIVIFEISTLKFAQLQNFKKKQKWLNLGPKMPYLGMFRINFKILLLYLKSAPSSLSSWKVSRKNKNAKFWDQKCLIWVFLGWSLKIILSYLRSAPRICLIVKFGEKIKMPNFGTENTLYGYFQVRISKNYCHILNNNGRICETAKFLEKMKMPKFGTKIWVFWAWNI